VSLEVVAERYSVSRDALYRHMRNHVPDETRAQYIADVPIREIAAKATEQGGNLIDYFVIVRGMLFQQLQTVAAHGDVQGTNNTSRALIEVLREIGRFTGELLSASSVTNNVTNNYAVFTSSPAFAELQAMLVTTLAPYPEALAAVVAGLQRLDAQAGNPPVGAPLIDLKPVSPRSSPGAGNG
jgi:hypothetical protein